MYRGRLRYGQDYRGWSRYNSNNKSGNRYNARGNERYERFDNNHNNRGEVIEVKVIIGIRVGHMRDRTEIEMTVDV